MVQVISFQDAIIRSSGAAKRHLLLGNGFSIALKPDIFSYGSLFDNADFGTSSLIPALFKALNTNDFEIVIRHLQDSVRVLSIYSPDLTGLIALLKSEAEVIKDALVSAIATRHPDRPYDITPDQYASCRTFLSNFNHIFSLNYDVLLYWTLMQTEVDERDLLPDDGFRHPENGAALPWVSWQQGNSATVHYLHGALHLFDNESEIIKFTWSKTDKPIVEQIRESLDHGRYPVFVAEGKSETKKARILHNAYLHKASRSLEGCCNPARNCIFVYGHSLAANDDHIFHAITCGAASDLYVSVYGDPKAAFNIAIVERAEALRAQRLALRGRAYPLNITFYDAESATVWNG